MKYLFITLSILSILSCKYFKSPEKGFSKLDTAPSKLETMGFSEADITVYYTPANDSSGLRTFPNKDSTLVKKVTRYIQKGDRLEVLAEKGEWYAIKFDGVDLFVLKNDVKYLVEILLDETKLNPSESPYPLMWLSSQEVPDDAIDYCEDINSEVEMSETKLKIPLKNGKFKTYTNIDEDENHSFEEISSYAYKGCVKNFGAVIAHYGFEWWEHIVVDLNNGKEYKFGGMPFLSPDEKYIVEIDYNPYDGGMSDITIYEKKANNIHRISHEYFNTWEPDTDVCSGLWDKDGNFYFDIKLEEFRNVSQSVKLDFSRLKEFSMMDTTMYFVSESGSKGLRDSPNKNAKIVEELGNGSILDIKCESKEWYLLHSNQFVMKKDVKPLDYLKLNATDLNATSRNANLHLYPHKLPEFEERHYYDYYVTNYEGYNNDLGCYTYDIGVTTKDKKTKKTFNTSADTKFEYLGTCNEIGILIGKVTNGVSEGIIINKDSGEELRFPGFPALTRDNKFIVSINFDSVNNKSSIVVYGMNNNSLYIADSVSYSKWRVDSKSLKNLGANWDMLDNLYFNVAPINFEYAYQGVKLNLGVLRKSIEESIQPISIKEE